LVMLRKAAPGRFMPVETRPHAAERTRSPALTLSAALAGLWVKIIRLNKAINFLIS
jgi:hypothetical protein